MTTYGLLTIRRVGRGVIIDHAAPWVLVTTEFWRQLEHADLNRGVQRDGDVLTVEDSTGRVVVYRHAPAAAAPPGHVALELQPVLEQFRA